MKIPTRNTDRTRWKHRLFVTVMFLLVSLLLTGCGNQRSFTDVPDVTGDPAAALVQRYHMGAGLESLANEAAQSTATFRMIARRQGDHAATQLVETEIAKALPVYQAQWDRNLALIYSRHFSQEELRSLATLGRRSPYADKFAATHETVAAQMRKMSSPLLERLVTEALTRANDQSSAVGGDARAQI